MIETQKPLIVNLFALIFSSMPEINSFLQTIVLILSIAVSIAHLVKNNNK